MERVATQVVTLPEIDAQRKVTDAEIRTLMVSAVMTLRRCSSDHARAVLDAWNRAREMRRARRWPAAA